MSAPLGWTEVRALAPEGWLELVAETLTSGGAASAAFGSPSLGTDAAPAGFDYVRTFFAAAQDTPERRAGIARALSRLAETTGAAELAGLTAEFRRLPPEDYATSWRKSWRPFRVGRLAVLAPSRASPTGVSRPRADDVVLVLEPGGAFGTGRHPTTRACLRAVQERVRRGERVLDAGSGSGILSVAALLFGASRALGFDVDPNAEPYARALADANGVSARCEIRTGGFEVLRDDDGPFDGVLANVYADVIRESGARLSERLRPGGWFAFSGCSAANAAATREVVSGLGLSIEETRVRGRWSTFLGIRRV